jgi:hypothetical protein
VSAYRTAIDQTIAAVDRRARYFRNQVVIVVTIAAAVALAAFVWSAAALWAWLLLVPACGLFFCADATLLNEWRSDVLQPWVARELDLVAWSQAIRANPVLPRETTGAMLATLPMAGDLVAEQKILTPTRQAIAASSLAFHRSKSDALLLNAIASAVIVGVLLATLWMRAWTPLLGLAVLVVLPAVRAWTTRRWQKRCETEVAACRTHPGFNEEDYGRIRAGIG